MQIEILSVLVTEPLGVDLDTVPPREGDRLPTRHVGVYVCVCDREETIALFAERLLDLERGERGVSKLVSKGEPRAAGRPGRAAVRIREGGGAVLPGTPSCAIDTVGNQVVYIVHYCCRTVNRADGCTAQMMWSPVLGTAVVMPRSRSNGPIVRFSRLIVLEGLSARGVSSRHARLDLLRSQCDRC